MNYIKVLDKYGKVNNWTIEYDAGDYYEVFYKNSITVLRKDKCYDFEGNLFSSEIRNFYEDEDEGGKTTGSEQCNICKKEIYNLSRLTVLENSDKYICKKCAKTLKSRVKSAIN